MFPPSPLTTDKVEDSMERNYSQVPIEDGYPFLEGILNIMKILDPKDAPYSGICLGTDLEEGEIS